MGNDVLRRGGIFSEVGETFVNGERRTIPSPLHEWSRALVVTKGIAVLSGRVLVLVAVACTRGARKKGVAVAAVPCRQATMVGEVCSRSWDTSRGGASLPQPKSREGAVGRMTINREILNDFHEIARAVWLKLARWWQWHPWSNVREPTRAGC